MRQFWPMDEIQTPSRVDETIDAEGFVRPALVQVAGNRSGLDPDY
jgi:hypothetical protein